MDPVYDYNWPDFPRCKSPGIVGLSINSLDSPRHTLNNCNRLCRLMQLSPGESSTKCATLVGNRARVVAGINVISAIVPIPGETTSLGICDCIQTGGRSIVNFVGNHSLGSGLDGACIEYSTC